MRMCLTLRAATVAAFMAAASNASAAAEPAPEFARQAPSTNTTHPKDSTKHELSFRRLIPVYDTATQTGIAGAKVFDRLTRDSMPTSASGHVALVPGFVNASGALLEISKEGYTTAGPILVDPTVDAVVEVPMSKLVTRPLATMLPSVITTAKFNLGEDRGGWSTFDDRRRRCTPRMRCSFTHGARFSALP